MSTTRAPAFEEYTGGRTEQSIVTWVLKKAGPPAVELETIEAAAAFEKENRWGSWASRPRC